jgi:hypothetical protein
MSNVLCDFFHDNIRNAYIFLHLHLHLCPYQNQYRLEEELGLEQERGTEGQGKSSSQS